MKPPAPSATTPAGLEVAALPTDAVEVGRVVGAWGVKGGLKLKPFAADPQALFATRRWFLLPPEADRGPPPARAGSWPVLLRVIQAREHADGVLATAHDLTDRDAAEALKGARVFVPRSSFPSPGDDEFYWVDLIGLEVHNRDGQPLGTVLGLLETGPHCVLRIGPPGGGPDVAEEVLIPFVSAYVDAVDLAGRRLTVDWHHGD